MQALRRTRTRSLRCVSPRIKLLPTRRFNSTHAGDSSHEQHHADHGVNEHFGVSRPSTLSSANTVRRLKFRWADFFALNSSGALDIERLLHHADVNPCLSCPLQIRYDSGGSKQRAETVVHTPDREVFGLQETMD